jgi:hypothetical protein
LRTIIRRIPTVSIGVNISDPDSLYNYSRIVLYNESLNILSLKDNTSLNFVTQFTGLSEGHYYFQVFAIDNRSDFIADGLRYFTVCDIQGTANCNSNEHALWSILPLIILAGILLYMLASIDAGIFGTI